MTSSPAGEQHLRDLARLRRVRDRIAHLLLALRTDEAGFATVANLAFAGAGWRVRRRLPARMRGALREL